MEPDMDPFKSNEFVLSSRDDFRGVLYNAFQGIPTRISFTYEAATDNAITNNENTTSSRAARGSLSAISNPFGDIWTNNYTYLNRVNWYIEKMVLDKSKTIPTPVKFDINPAVNLQVFYYTLGEAYFLRAWYHFDLLKYYGGIGADGKAYGIPLTTSFLEIGDELDLPRNTYQQCVDRIAADCDSAAKYLPLVYSKATGTLTEGVITEAGHPSGLSAKALKARTFLYAASPAFNTTNDVALWDKAATAAADAITASTFDDLMTFANYFNKANLNDKAFNNKDIFFRGPIVKASTNYESENFPPRAFSGRGIYNPSQNLVDAFPMNDGYPMGTSPSKTIDPNNVANNRDPRLDLFVVRDGETWAKLTIDTKAGGLDAYGSDPNATRSGYYLQKLLNSGVSLETGKVVSTDYAAILLAKPELYLNFAEASINATGNPDDKKYGFSAREVLAKVRNRALGSGKDLYLATVTDKAGFLAVVKNERRIELCFEDFRFWDLRRWSNGTSDVAAINAPVYSIYSTTPVETRSYKSPYMPLPFGELLKTNNLVNNAGW
jgi:hypothetical protein